MVLIKKKLFIKIMVLLVLILYDLILDMNEKKMKVFYFVDM